MNKVTISLLSLLTLSTFASIKNFDYRADHTFTLYSKGADKYVEYKNTRLSKGQINIDLEVSGRLESHVVKLGLKDFKADDNLLRATHLNKDKTVALDYAESKTKLKVGSSSYLNDRLRMLINSNIDKTLKSIDGEIRLTDFKTRVKAEILKCNKSRNYLVCKVSSNVSGERTQKNSKMKELLGHLFELKKEMIANSSTNYDIEGYREFLTKAEKILDESLKLETHNKNNMKKTLMSLKDLLINERIDSYEYTAIRSQSIVTFVDLLLKKIKVHNA